MKRRTLIGDVPIQMREGNVIVEGDGPRALDSRVLRPIRADEIREWWIPVLQAQAAGHGD